MLCRCPGYVTALGGACGLGMRLLANLSVLHHMGVPLPVGPFCTETDQEVESWQQG